MSDDDHCGPGLAIGMTAVVRHRAASVVVACLLLAIATPGGAVDRAAVDAVPADGDVAVFVGPTDPDRVDAFIGGHADRSIRRVLLDSPGGDIRAALRLANWIVDRGADIEVVGLCASSCANYLFAAGRCKIIDDGAIVLWHGSARQADFRVRLDDCGRRIDELTHAGGELVDRYQRALTETIAICSFLHQAVVEQDAFFARVGADEIITRMGQEPHDFHAIWTVPVDLMARLGYHGVEAPADYADAAYLHRADPFDAPSPVRSLGFDRAGHGIELAR